MFKIFLPLLLAVTISATLVIQAASIRIISSIVRTPDTGYIYALASESGILLRSTTNGNTWEKADYFAAIMRGLAVSNQNTLFAYGYRFDTAVLRKPAGSDTFTPTITGMYPVMDIVQTGSGTLLAVGASAQYTATIARSTDDGLNWTIVESGQIGYFGVGFAKAVVAQNGHVMAFREYDHKVYRSTNDGQNWSQVATLPGTVGFSPFAAIRASDGNLYVAGSKCLNPECDLLGLVYKSSDNGQSWTVHYQANGLGFASLLEPKPGQFYAVTMDKDWGGMSTLMRSTNFGQSWSSFNELYTPAVLATGYSTPHALFASDNQTMYVGTGGGDMGVIYAVSIP